LIPIKRAFFSAADRADLVELAQGLRELGVELLALGETAAFLRTAEVAVQDAESVLAVIPALRHGTVDLVVVNLHPLGADQVTPIEDVLRSGDLDGLSVIMAAARDYRATAALVDPADYGPTLEELRERGALTPETGLRLAERAFNYIVRYNAAIAEHLASEPLPLQLNLAYPKALELRAGGDKQRQAALYVNREAELPRQLHGSPLTYEYLLELDTALQIPYSFERPTAVIIKHGDPCGLASAEVIEEAFARAYAADERGAEWGLAGLNRPVSEEGAKLLAKHSIDGVLAPKYEEGALEILRKRKGLHVLEGGRELLEGRVRLELKQTALGLLARQRKGGQTAADELKVVSRRSLTEAEWTDALFAWRALAWFRQEAVLLVGGECTVGVGAGQPSLLDATELAIRKAAERTRGSVLVAGTALPSRDVVDLAAAARVTAIIALAGRASDAEVIRAADEQGIALVFTGHSAHRYS
jgi:phosphoribosylaminoimidazolecarboxamide formyltransferase/IMP cyclohydrolase